MSHPNHPVSLHDMWRQVQDLYEGNRYAAAAQLGAEAWKRRHEADGDLVARLALDYAGALGKLGEYPRAVEVLQEAIQRTDVPTRLQVGLYENLGHWVAQAGDMETGLAYLLRAREMATTLPDPSDRWHVGRMDYLIGRLHLAAGRVDLALHHLEAARRVLDPTGNAWTAWAQVYHGYAMLAAGRIEEARELGQRNVVGESEVTIEALILLAQVAQHCGSAADQNQYAKAATCLARRLGRDDLYRKAHALLTTHGEEVKVDAPVVGAAHDGRSPGAWHGQRNVS